MLTVLHSLASQLKIPNPQQIGWHSCRKTRADHEHAEWDRGRHVGCLYAMFWVTPPTLGAPNVIYLPPLLPPTHPAAVSKKNEDKQTLSKSKMEWRSGEPGTPLNHIFYTQNLYVPLYLIVINVHPERGYIPSRRPLNKPIIVSNNFRGL